METTPAPVAASAGQLPQNSPTRSGNQETSTRAVAEVVFRPPLTSGTGGTGNCGTVGDQPVVLLLGARDDPQIGRIVKALDAEDACSTAVLDFRTSLFDLETSEDGRLSLRVDGIRIPPTAAVFDRTMFRKGTDFYPSGGAGEADFTMEEFSALLRLIAATFGVNVVNPLVSRSCMVKPRQQVLAAAAGLLVPRTVVSNDKGALTKFVSGGASEFIIKPLSEAVVHADPIDGGSRLIMTNKVDLELLRREPPETFAPCPCFLQHEIRKRFEMRVVCIGPTMLAFRIDSQRHATSSTDWRRLSTTLNYEPCELPPATASAIARFMFAMGLVAGHLDLIVDHNDRVWFLECNNQGAWGWLDDIVGGEIARTYAKHLLGIATTASTATSLVTAE